MAAAVVVVGETRPDQVLMVAALFMVAVVAAAPLRAVLVVLVAYHSMVVMVALVPLMLMPARLDHNLVVVVVEQKVGIVAQAPMVNALLEFFKRKINEWLNMQ
jgi:hypothetical protein